MEQTFHNWITQYTQVQSITTIPGDASARQYFRVITPAQSLIAVMAPPTQENTLAFASIAQGFAQVGLHVPQVKAMDAEKGFLLLSDLGDVQLLTILNKENVHHYYSKALNELLRFHQCNSIEGWQLPRFDRDFLQKELDRFDHWYLDQHLGLNLSQKEVAMLQAINEHLIHSAITQPQVCVHRDYHSRNLMLLPNDEIGVLDFQDAVWGPITYDLVSLLRDCYIDWPVDTVYQWVNQFWDNLVDQKKTAGFSQAQFTQWFDWMGLQRHLKVLGIFARLYRRDNKPNY
jgi:aminoglycoside/choline kinase family phosphotransferase